MKRHEIVIQTVDVGTRAVVRSTSRALTPEFAHSPELGLWVECVLEVHEREPICPACGQHIDPNMCYCGVGPNDSHDNHVFTPIGCICGYNR